LRLRGETVANWGSLLANIATRRAMDRLRKRYRERMAFAAAEVEPVGESPPDGRLLGDELRQRIRETLARLPEKQAEAFWLRHVEDFATEDVARHLNVRPSHVRVLVHRAVQQLRTALTPIYGLEVTQGEGNDRK
jgi:RNA polymerase sigma factor (sigma-70 family)